VILSHTILGSATVIPHGTRPHPTQAQLRESLSFSHFDTLYAQAPDQYLEMIDLYAQEYEVHFTGVDTALEQKDEPAFRRIKHKLIYSLHLLDLTSLYCNMEVMARQFQDMDGYQRITARHAYSAAYTYIATRLDKQRLLLRCNLSDNQG